MPPEAYTVIADTCTPLDATSCPACGDCTCPDEPGFIKVVGQTHIRTLLDPSCPLHGVGSEHAEPEW
jgi:hypothetical protein